MLNFIGDQKFFGHWLGKTTEITSFASKIELFQLYWETCENNVWHEMSQKWISKSNPKLNMFYQSMVVFRQNGHLYPKTEGNWKYFFKERLVYITIIVETFLWKGLIDVDFIFIFKSNLDYCCNYFNDDGYLFSIGYVFNAENIRAQ